MSDLTTQLRQIRLVRIASGEDILLALRRYVADHQIANAVILSGFGSVTHYHFHVVADGNLPPAEAFSRGERALDIVSMSGAVLAGRVHAHITFTDDRAALGGHLEEGCRVLTFAVAVLGVLDTDADLSAWDRWDA